MFETKMKLPPPLYCKITTTKIILRIKLNSQFIMDCLGKPRAKEKKEGRRRKSSLHCPIATRI